MPTYLCHGFRWKRRSIRVYVVIQNLDDAAPEWITSPGSTRCFIESFYSLFDFLPDCAVPPPDSSSAAPLSLPDVENQAIDHGNERDDDEESFHTTRSLASRDVSRSSSRSQLHGPSSTQNSVTSSTPPRQEPSILRSHSNKSSASDHRAPDLANSYRPNAKHGSNLRTGSRSHRAPPSPPSSRPLLSSHSQISGAGSGPDCLLAQDWSPVKLLEEYDPANLEEVTRPHAYVADYITRIDSSCSVLDEIQRYETHLKQQNNPAVTGQSPDDRLFRPKKNSGGQKGRDGWLEKLRDQLQDGEDIRWYIVVNGGEERPWPQTGAPKSRANSHFSVSSHQALQQAPETRQHGLEEKREQLRRELGYRDGGIDQLPERKLEGRQRPPGTVESPPQPGRLPGPKDPTSPKQPESPSAKRGLRRLFSRQSRHRTDL